MKPLPQTLSETVQALNDQLTKARYGQLNDQRAKDGIPRWQAQVTPPWTPPWPM